MSAWVIDLLASWMGDFGECHSALVWRAVPHCVTSLEIKSIFLKTLYEWMSITTSLGFSSFDHFLDSCNLS